MAYLDELVERYPKLSGMRPQIMEAYQILVDAYAHGGKLLIAGNGGSCADAEHIVGELMKGFVKRREVPQEFAEKLEAVDESKGRKLAMQLQGGLPAIALTGHPGLATAFLNDVDGELIYAQQTYGYGEMGDVFLGISTSGNAKNIEYAVMVAKAKGMKIL
ncbi:MAG: SIS domain-containing protein, partial [Hungatella sp.]